MREKTRFFILLGLLLLSLALLFVLNSSYAHFLG
jgi:LPXTG-motif cell wall-anchored protein